MHTFFMYVDHKPLAVVLVQNRSDRLSKTHSSGLYHRGKGGACWRNTNLVVLASMINTKGYRKSMYTDFSRRNQT